MLIKCALFVALQSPPEKEKEKEARHGVSLAGYRAFFRELDVEVLSVLQCGLLSRSLLDSEQHTNVRTHTGDGMIKLWSDHH